MWSGRFFSILLVVGTISFNAFADGIMEVTTAAFPGDFMPLVRTEVTVEIYDQVAITTIENTFNNTATFDVDVKFHFPVPNTASVTGFGDYIGGVLHMWGLQPGQGGGGGGTSNPSLEEYLGENPFTISMQDIPPGEKTIYLQFTGLLDYSFGDIIYTYPLWTPNYFIINPTQEILIELSVLSQRTLTGGLSQNYPGTYIEHNDSTIQAVFSLINAFAPFDFDLQYSVSQEDIGAWLLNHVEADSLPDSDHGYFLLICEPGELQVGGVVQKYFTFIMDRSGSMSGSKIEQAKDAAIACVSLLDTIDFFNVITFDSNIDMFVPNPVQATAANIAAAIDYIEDIYPGGSTNINGALLAGLNQTMGTNSANQIIFLTDGQPTYGVTSVPQILNNVSNANDDSACIFSFGIGSDVSEELLEGLALENWGDVLYIEPGASIDETVINFFLGIMNPVFVNVNLGFNPEIDTRDVFPVGQFNIYYGSQTLIFGRNQDFGTADILLSGTVAGTDTTLVYEDYVFPTECPQNSFVARMWAISFIDYWTAWMVVNGEVQEIIDQIIFLSLKYGILTPYTGYQGIDELEIVAFSGIPQGSGLMLNWVLSQYEPGVTYDLYRSAAVNGAFIQLNTTPLTAPSFYDDTAVPGQVYYYKVKIIAMDGDKFSGIFMVGAMPENYVLSQNYPNPFNAVTEIAYSLPNEAYVKLEVFDLLGRRVRMLDYGLRMPGLHHLQWDGRDFCGTPVSSGQYFYRLTAKPKYQGEEFSAIKKAALLK